MTFSSKYRKYRSKLAEEIAVNQNLLRRQEPGFVGMYCCMLRLSYAPQLTNINNSYVSTAWRGTFLF